MLRISTLYQPSARRAARFKYVPDHHWNNRGPGGA